MRYERPLEDRAAEFNLRVRKIRRDVSPKKSFKTDIYTGMRPLYWAAQFTGLAPYAYVRSEQTGEESIDISRRCNVKKTIWALLLLGVQFIGIVCKLAESIISPPDSLMDLMNDLLQFPFFSATSMGALMLALSINRKKMLQFINTLSVVDRFLFRDDSIYKKRSIKLLIIVTCSAASSALIFYCDVYYYVPYNILYVITIYLPDYIWSINELQFMNIVDMLRVRLSTLNRYILLAFVQENYIENASSNFRKRPRRHVTNRNASVSCIKAEPLRYHVPEGLMGSPVQTCSRKSKITLDTIELTETYNRLYEMCRLINSMYGYMLLQEFTSYTVCIIADGYNLVSYFVALYKADDPLIPPAGCPALILWNLSNLIRPFAICLVCQRVTNEITRTVNQIEILKLQPDLDADVSNQLRRFSKQIKHCKIEFSACGFFDINLSHFCAVVLTATTYITMLVFLER
jgi:hypothetical protein